MADHGDYIKALCREIELSLIYKSAITSAAERMNRDPLELATALQGGVIAELVEVCKLTLPKIEEIRLVDLGAVRDAEMQDYQDRKIMARKELAETVDIINRIKAAIAKIPQPKKKTK